MKIEMVVLIELGAPAYKTLYTDEGTWGSNTPTCSSWDRRALASIRLVEMNEEQKSRSPMATPSITMFGLSDAFIPEGNTSRLWWENTSHLDTLTKRPRAGP